MFEPAYSTARYNTTVERAVVSPNMLREVREALGLSLREVGRRIAPLLGLTDMAAFKRVSRYEQFTHVRSLSAPTLDALREVFTEAAMAASGA